MSPESIIPRGLLIVVQLPYHNDFSIDWETYTRELDWLQQQGADGYVLAMVTEILRISDAERAMLVEHTATVAGPGVPVIASVGAESTAVLIERGLTAAKAGATALMATPPHLTRCSPDALLDYYRSLLREVSLPLIVQDASAYVGNAIPVETLARLWHEFPEQVAFKPEAKPLTQNHARLMELTGGGAQVYEGSSGIGLFGAHPLGLAGTMPGADIPWAIRKLWDLLEAGNRDDAYPVHAALNSLVSLISSLDEYLAIEKRLLVEQGIFQNTLVRGPTGFRLDPATEKEVIYAFHRLREVYHGHATGN